MPIKHQLPQEIFKSLQTTPDAVLIDVRSEPEFGLGHPKGAYNIPIMNADPASGKMVPNQEFENVFCHIFSKSTKIYLSCKSGGRSERACEILSEKGFKDLTNMTAGYHGHGKTPGWLEAALPTSTTTEPGRSYQDLLKRTKGHE